MRLCPRCFGQLPCALAGRAPSSAADTFPNAQYLSKLFGNMDNKRHVFHPLRGTVRQLPLHVPIGLAVLSFAILLSNYAWDNWAVMFLNEN